MDQGPATRHRRPRAAPVTQPGLTDLTSPPPRGAPPAAPQPLTQTVIAGQKAVFVTVAVEGSGQGSAAQSVTLQVLGPDRESATTAVTSRC
jgi:hypothetical protein